MIDPDRVMQMAYLPGEKVRAELGFDWDGEPTAVTAHFRRLVGSRFSARHLEPGISRPYAPGCAEEKSHGVGPLPI
jgi:hypothetical protein